MKKISMSLLAVIIVISLTACDSGSDTENTKSPGNESTSQSENSQNVDKTSPTPISSVDADNPVHNEPRSMTVDDVRTIASSIGPNLTMDDLSDYAVDDIDTGYYGYRVVDGVVPYNLLVMSADMQTVISAVFYDATIGGVRGNTTEYIDIRYYDVDKFIADGTQELAQPFLEEIETLEGKIVGTWNTDAGSVTQFFEDGTGKTIDDAGEHEFTWEAFSLIEAAVRNSSIRSYIKTIYGDEVAEHFGESGWGTDTFLLSLTFVDITVTFDFPFTLEEGDILTINTMNLGQILSPTQDPSLRFEWVALSREDRPAV